MIERVKDIFNKETVYPIFSDKTDNFYMTEDKKAYVFESVQEANEFIIGKNDMGVRARKTPKFSSFLNTCYALGFSEIELKIKGETEPHNIKVGPQKNFRQYVNPGLNAAIMLLAETKQKKYLMELSTKEFIVPIKIQETEDKGRKKPFIYHATLLSNQKNDKNAPVMYLAFADYLTFRRWPLQSVWDPIKIKFWQLKEIVGESGVAINPGTRGVIFVKPAALKEIPCNVPPIGEIRSTTDVSGIDDEKEEENV